MFGFIKVAAGTPKITVGNCKSNADNIIELINRAQEAKVQLLVLPELCITGYTCGDLFLQNILLDEAEKQLNRILEASKETGIIITAGLPVPVDGSLYNCAAIFTSGRLLGVIPKTSIPNYAEYYEQRHFTSSKYVKSDIITLCGQQVPFGTDLLFCSKDNKDFVIGVELCEDLWVPNPKSIGHAMSGATIIANLSASNEITGKDIYRNQLVQGQSGRLICGYIYASAGEGESTTDLVFSGHNIIAENGTILAESERFSASTLISTEIDVQKLSSERRRMSSYFADYQRQDYRKVEFNLKEKDFKLTRPVQRYPFVPQDKLEMEKRCNEILSIQSCGLKKRLEHTACKTAVIGISGGLDSTLALLVTARAFDMLGKDRRDIIAITMPCYGTTDRTYTNAVGLIQAVGATFKEINIHESVNLHLKDIGHDNGNLDVTFENAQARERTQILMDIANKTGGIVIGTGDLSELALGWSTYNGDHMSMYAVNCGVPKTLVRHLISYYNLTVKDPKLKDILSDILDTPVSPELLPPVDGEIAQKTEDIIGPYELHDFYLYYDVRYGFSPKKILFLAENAFNGCYERKVILKWLKVFYKRFFSQQFKRSCIPDGPKVGSVALSPRGDWRMPSDASPEIWLKELDGIE